MEKETTYNRVSLEESEGCRTIEEQVDSIAEYCKKGGLKVIEPANIQNHEIIARRGCNGRN